MRNIIKMCSGRGIDSPRPPLGPVALEAGLGRLAEQLGSSGSWRMEEAGVLWAKHESPGPAGLEGCRRPSSFSSHQRRRRRWSRSFVDKSRRRDKASAQGRPPREGREAGLAGGDRIRGLPARIWRRELAASSAQEGAALGARNSTRRLELVSGAPAAAALVAPAATRAPAGGGATGLWR
ncbi:hypothetical protein ZWY2020_025164 [Hordeum vulgare]|nr:hypothetical protein ZWY2020_025164 [Hordeum vulgare]